MKNERADLTTARGPFGWAVHCRTGQRQHQFGLHTRRRAPGRRRRSTARCGAAAAGGRTATAGWARRWRSGRSSSQCKAPAGAEGHLGPANASGCMSVCYDSDICDETLAETIAC